MAEARRATITFDGSVYQALLLRAAQIEGTVSDLVNEAVRLRLAEDAEDIAAFKERAHEPSLGFEQVVEDLKSRGKL